MLLIALAGSALVPATTAGAAPVVVSATPIAGWQTNGPVYATAVIGDRVYAGGNFTEVRNSSGTQTLARANLVAFDRNTGAVETGFQADTNGTVRALATNGSRLFVGGVFTTIGATNRSRIGAVSPSTGSVIDEFAAGTSSGVFALAVQGSRLYVGGSFGLIKGTSRPRLAAVSTTTGDVQSGFFPAPNLVVDAIAVSPDGSAVYAGGHFTSIGGRAQSYFAKLDSDTGANADLDSDFPPTTPVMALETSPSGARVFVGTTSNRLASFSTTTGRRQWVQIGIGDVQAIRYHEGNVYFGFHEGYPGDLSVRILAADAATGVLENWRPPVNSFNGVWSISVGDGTLFVGGEFTNFNGVATQGVALLPAVPPPPDMSIGSARVVEGNAGIRRLRFNVTLSHPVPWPTAATYATTNLTAGAEDFNARSGTVVVPAGATAAAIAIDIKGDTTVEAAEKFRIQLSSPFAAFLRRSVDYGYILNDDPGTGPAVSIGSATVVEGNEGNRLASLTLTLSSPRPSAVTVDYDTGNGSATANQDYGPVSGTFTFPPNTTYGRVLIEIRPDTSTEGSETIPVSLSNASGVAILRASGAITILNDDT